MAEEEQSKKKSNYFDRWLEKQAAEKKNDTVADEQSEKDEKITDEQPKKAEEEKKSDEKIEDVIVDGDFRSRAAVKTVEQRNLIKTPQMMKRKSRKM